MYFTTFIVPEKSCARLSEPNIRTSYKRDLKNGGVYAFVHSVKNRPVLRSGGKLTKTYSVDKDFVPGSHPGSSVQTSSERGRSVCGSCWRSYDREKTDTNNQSSRITRRDLTEVLQ